jgi:hypothetical protein
VCQEELLREPRRRLFGIELSVWAEPTPSAGPALDLEPTVGDEVVVTFADADQVREGGRSVPFDRDDVVDLEAKR